MEIMAQTKKQRMPPARRKIPETVIQHLDKRLPSHVQTRWTIETTKEFIYDFNNPDLPLQKIADKYKVKVNAVSSHAERLINFASRCNGNTIPKKKFKECIGVCCVFHENGVRKRRKRWIERGMHMCARCHDHIRQIGGNDTLNQTIPL